MKQFRILNGKTENRSRSLKKNSKRYAENILTSVKLTGVLTPWSKYLGPGASSDYKLVCGSGLEYFIVAESIWSNVLADLSWKEVKVIGLLNLSNMTLIPKKVFPVGPAGSKEKVIDITRWKNQNAIKTIIRNVSDWVITPIAARPTITT